MAATKRPRRAPKPIPIEPLETFTTRLPSGLHARLKIAAVHHKVSVQVLAQRGLEMVLGGLVSKRYLWFPLLLLVACGEEHTGIVKRAVPRTTVSGGGCKTCMTTTYAWCRVYLTDGWHCDDGTDDCEGIDVGQSYLFESCWSKP